MQCNAEQVHPTFSADACVGANVANNGSPQVESSKEQPPPAYATASAPPDYGESQMLGAPQYCGSLQYGIASSEAGILQPAQSQNAQVNLVGAAAYPSGNSEMAAGEMWRHQQSAGQAEAYAATNAAGYVGATQLPTHQPQPPAYTPSCAPPSYGGGQFFGAPQYGGPVHYGNYPNATGTAQHVAPQNVQINLVSAATPLTPVIITQQAPVVLSPPTYLGWSIFNFLCCFWPLGLAAIVYSAKVGSSGSHEDAKKYSLTARNLNIAATTIAPILVIVIVGAVVGTAPNISSSRYSSSYYDSANYQPYSYYYSYGYTYYYTYLMYYTNITYTYFTVYASFDNVFAGSYLYSYTDFSYSYVTASRYSVGSYYQYAQGYYSSG